MQEATIDFETRSTVDLRAAGPWKYAEADTTQVICLSVKIDGGPSKLWYPEWVERILRRPPEISKEYVAQVARQCEIHAHNLEFERAIWRHKMLPILGVDLELARCHCTAARAAAMGLPRKLDDVCKVLGTPIKKSAEGHRLMLQMCKPRSPRKAEREADPDWRNTLYWHEKPEQLIALGEYCKTDTDAEYSVGQVARKLIPFEQRVWRLDQVINERGAHVDIRSASAIVARLAEYSEKLLAELKNLTDGEVDSPRQIQKSKEWLAANGLALNDLQKATVEAATKRDDLAPEVARFLKIRRLLSKSSTAKFTALLNRAQDDGRIRSLLMYCAAGTGRWGGKAFQPQNLPRDSYEGETIENALEMFLNNLLDLMPLVFDDPTFVASRCVRGMVDADNGNDLLAADFSGVEGRGVPWLCDMHSKLDLFREGVDTYIRAAKSIFGQDKEIGKDSLERQVGKVSELAFGYQGAIGAYVTMAGGYSIDLDAMADVVLAQNMRQSEFEDAQRNATAYLRKNPGALSYRAALACDITKTRWRDAHPEIVAYWGNLETAAIDAVKNPGQIYTVNKKVSFTTWKDALGNNYLLCRLPSGRILYYFDPDLRKSMMPWGKMKLGLTYMTVDSTTGRWVRCKTYGGKLCENITQAVCRDLLAHAMLNVEAAGYEIVLHVHDEIVSEIPKGFGSLGEFIQIMTQLPAWADGFPLEAAGWRGKRFRK